MHRRRLAAPRTNPISGMTTRAFGAVHVNVALLTLRSTVLNRDTRLALRLNIGCDLGDMVATGLEWRDGDLPAGALAASAALQSAAMATWATALRSLSAA
jgi:hypothetical protein